MIVSPPLTVFDTDTEHVAAAGWDDRPAPPGRPLWGLHHSQRGEDLVPHPAEAFMASTQCSVPSGVDLSVHGHGVRRITYFHGVNPNRPAS